MMASLVTCCAVSSRRNPAPLRRIGSLARYSALWPNPRRRWRAVESLVVLALAVVGSARGGEETHRIRSPRQGGETTVRIFTPDNAEPEHAQTILYVLPVEAGATTRWGDPADEVRRSDLASEHGLIVAIPTFSALPWYADHPSDPELQQESYLLKDVLPLVERLHAADSGPPERLLVGFSKSGWGAWALLLRHPDLFSKAAAWDAPLMQETPDRFGMEPIFGSQSNFDRYQITPWFRTVRTCCDRRAAWFSRVTTIRSGHTTLRYTTC